MGCAVSDFKMRLRNAMTARNSLVCVGLDPQPGRTHKSEIFEFNRKIVDETADFVAAYKPQSAFYEAVGDEGWAALGKTIEYIRKAAPHALVILDVKRGDVPNTAEACAQMAFDHFKADAATVNPYMGSDGVKPFLKRPGKGAFLLCRTSNPKSGALQLLRVMSETNPGELRFLYEEVAKLIEKWGADQSDNAGAVVGATYPEELRRVRELCPTLPLLVPGIGAQGGNLEASVRAGLDAEGAGLLINSSRSIIYPEDPRTTRSEAERLRQAIHDVREKVLEENARTVAVAD